MANIERQLALCYSLVVLGCQQAGTRGSIVKRFQENDRVSLSVAGQANSSRWKSAQPTAPATELADLNNVTNLTVAHLRTPQRREATGRYPNQVLPSRNFKSHAMSIAKPNDGIDGSPESVESMVSDSRG